MCVRGWLIFSSCSSPSLSLSLSLCMRVCICVGFAALKNGSKRTCSSRLHMQKKRRETETRHGRERAIRSLPIPFFHACETDGGHPFFFSTRMAIEKKGRRREEKKTDEEGMFMPAVFHSQQCVCMHARLPLLIEINRKMREKTKRKNC